MYFGCIKMEIHLKDKEAAISARIPFTLKSLIQKFVTLDTHINESDFIRDAIREKIQRDAPHLYKEVFLENGT